MPSAGPLDVAVLVATFNRRAVTIRGLTALRDAFAALPDITATFYVVDDLSPDGTADAVRALGPSFVVTDGTGSLFWNGGMLLAHRVASAARRPDVYLLFNDDVVVDPPAIAAFFDTYRALQADRPAALSGAVVNASGVVTYAGFSQGSRWRPLNLQVVAPGAGPLPCDTFNGNFVAVPAPALDRLGGFDPAYIHQFGDVDLGLRLRAIGVPSFVAPRAIGLCEDNGTPVPSRRGLGERVRLGLSGREDMRQHAHFLRRFAPNRPVAAGLFAMAFLKRLYVLAANRPHLRPPAKG